MIGTIEIDDKGIPKAPISTYQPEKEICDLIMRIKQDYAIGDMNLHRSYEEFSNRSVLEEMNASQRLWNSYIPPQSTNPDEAWRSQTVRPLARNKMISIAAHVTATLLYPTVVAQNDRDEEDAMAAKVMEDILEWVTDRAEYDQVFLFGVISMLINPAAIVDVTYVEAFIKARQMADEGVKIKEVLDELNSGIRIGLVPVEELLIANVNEFHIQKQRFLIRTRYIDFDEAKSLYGNHKNFEHVRPGIKATLDVQTGLFYDIVDETNPTLVEESVYYNRREDMEIPLLNGIYMGKDEIEENTMKHRRTVMLPDGDVATIPVYKFAKSGYEPIDEMRFFYYKSAAAKLGPDQDLVDSLYNMILDGTFLSIMPPVNVFGSEEQDASVVYPGAVNYFSKEAKSEVMNIGQNVGMGLNTLQLVERSMSQSSQDDTRIGIATPTGRTAFEISRMEENAQIQLGLFGKMIGFLVKDICELIIDDIILHLTVGHINEVIGDEVRLKYNTFLIKQKSEGGRQIKKKIEFTEEAMGDVDIQSKQLELLKREEGNSRILLVNPYQFARMKYLVVPIASSQIGKSKMSAKAMNLEAYDRMIQNPMVDQQAVTRDFLVETFAEGETEKYMAKAPMPTPNPPANAPLPQSPQQGQENPLAALLQ